MPTTIAAYATPPLDAFGEDGGRLLRAMRLWGIFARSGRSPRPALNALLGPAAMQFSLLMETIVMAWPEVFITFPPCASRTSPDEATIMTLFSHAEANRLPHAHALLQDLLPTAERMRLWNAACRVVAERIGAP